MRFSERFYKRNKGLTGVRPLFFADAVSAATGGCLFGKNLFRFQPKRVVRQPGNVFFDDENGLLKNIAFGVPDDDDVFLTTLNHVALLFGRSFYRYSFFRNPVLCKKISVFS